jgi:hypothetical protein
MNKKTLEAFNLSHGMKEIILLDNKGRGQKRFL